MIGNAYSEAPYASEPASSGGGGGGTGLRSSLHHFWELDESSGDRVDSEGSADLSPTTVGSGSIGTASSPFSGLDAVQATTSSGGSSQAYLAEYASSNISLTSLPLTVAGWIKQAGSSTAGTLIDIYDASGDSDSTARAKIYRQSTGQLRAEFVTNSANGATAYESSTYATASSWVFVAARFKADSVELRVNNKAWQTSSTGATLDIDSDSVKLASLNGVDGTLDASHLGVWSRALSDTDVDDLYNNGDGLRWPLTKSAAATQATLTISSSTISTPISAAASQATLTLQPLGLALSATPSTPASVVATSSLLPIISGATLTATTGGLPTVSPATQATLTASAATLPSIPQTPTLSASTAGFTFEFEATHARMTVRAHNAIAGTPQKQLALATQTLTGNKRKLGSEDVN